MLLLLLLFLYADDRFCSDRYLRFSNNAFVNYFWPNLGIFSMPTWYFWKSSVATLVAVKCAIVWRSLVDKSPFMKYTRSSAVAKRPRDAPSPCSVVESFAVTPSYSRSLEFTPMNRACVSSSTSSYSSWIVTGKIKRDIGRKLRFFHTVFMHDTSCEINGCRYFRAVFNNWTRFLASQMV